MSDCCHEVPKKPVWYQGTALPAAIVLLLLVLLSYRIEALVSFRSSIFMYFGQIWWMLLVGFLIGGVIERFVPHEYVSIILARKKKRSIFYAVIFGFFMSACSHGILALGIQLHKKGASTPVVVSFLLASPWANLPTTLILYGFFGLKALYIVTGALVIAIVTGLLFQFFESRGWTESNPHTLASDENFLLLRDIRNRIRGYSFSAGQIIQDIKRIGGGSVALAKMVMGWILIGMGISALAAAFVPSEFFHRFMGPSAVGLFATLGFATVMEVCSEGTAPMAFEIFKQTGAFGNAFVFLTAGVATNYTQIALVWANMGKRAALWLPLITVPQVVLLGLIANGLFR